MTFMVLTDLFLKLYLCGKIPQKVWDSTKYFNDHYNYTLLNDYLNPSIMKTSRFFMMKCQVECIYMVLFHLSSERGTFITFIGRSANKMKTFLFDKCKIEVKNENFNCKQLLTANCACILICYIFCLNKCYHPID